MESLNVGENKRFFDLTEGKKKPTLSWCMGFSELKFHFFLKVRWHSNSLLPKMEETPLWIWNPASLGNTKTMYFYKTLTVELSLEIVLALRKYSLIDGLSSNNLNTLYD